MTLITNITKIRP